MHSAPSVTYPVGRSRFALYLVLLALGCGFAVMGMGALQTGASPRFVSLGLVLCAAGGLLAGLQWWWAPAGDLSWDGLEWKWESHRDANGGVVFSQLLVSLDLQSAMLLRRQVGRTASHWFWLEQSRCTDRWDALRRAVYSPAEQVASVDARQVQHHP